MLFEVVGDVTFLVLFELLFVFFSMTIFRILDGEIKILGDHGLTFGWFVSGGETEFPPFGLLLWLVTGPCITLLEGRASTSVSEFVAEVRTTPAFVKLDRIVSF